MTAYIATQKYQYSLRMFCKRNLLWKKSKIFSLDITSLVFFLFSMLLMLLSSPLHLFTTHLLLLLFGSRDLSLLSQKSPSGGFASEDYLLFLFVIKWIFVICQCPSCPLHFVDFLYLHFFPQVWCWMTNKSSPCSKMDYFPKEVCTFP